MVVPRNFRIMLLVLAVFAITGIAAHLLMRGDTTVGGDDERMAEARDLPEHVWDPGEEREERAAAEGPHGSDPTDVLYKQTHTAGNFLAELDAFMAMPVEAATGGSDRWVFKGPVGANLRGTKTNYCGRVRDLEIEDVPGLRVAGPTGGLFKMAGPFPVPLSDDLNTLNIGAFATSPRDPSLILLGTGDPPYSYGTGLWRTTDEGETWRRVLFQSVPTIHYKVMFQPGSDSVAYAANDQGLFQSTNRGATWNRRTLGPVTGVDVVPTAPNIVYAAERMYGVYKSTDFGRTFVQLTSFPLTGRQFFTASIGIAKSNINVVYVSVANDSGFTAGLYRTSDGGLTWEDRSYRDSSGAKADLHYSQGTRNNCIGVSPTDANVVLVGGGGLGRTTDGGLTWGDPPITHADMCVIKWRSDGKTVYCGNDGGVAISTDAGVTWASTPSVFPFMQFWSIEAAGTSTGMVFVGGTQDNAIINTSNNGTKWYYNLGADGGPATLDKNEPGTQFAKIYSNASTYGGFRTTDHGETWLPAGLDVTSPGGLVRTDLVAPAKFYYLHGNKVSISTDKGETWTQLGAALPTTAIASIGVARRSATIAPVYAVLPDTANKIMFYDGKGWVQRNNGLPTAYFNSVSPHPTNNALAYAYTLYTAYPGQKIYKTTNQGSVWTNASGDLPNLNITGVIAHPTNPKILFVSTQWFGMLKSTDGGATWFRWMNGMPKTLWVESLAYIDSTAINGKFYVVAGSHGRGVWVREGSAMEVTTSVTSGEQPDRFVLEQNYPNPFNPSTTITFSLPEKERVTLQVFDINGRMVKDLIRGEEYPAGQHQVRFDGHDLASGTYLYRLTSPRQTLTRKMLLLK